MTVEKMNFEDAMKKLEQLVEKLEDPNTNLDEAVKLFEEGQELRQICHEHLKNAELQIQKVMSAADGSITTSNLELPS